MTAPRGLSSPLHESWHPSPSVVFIQIEIDHFEKTEILRASNQKDQPQDPAQEVQQPPAMRVGDTAPIDLRELLPTLGEGRSSEQTQDRVSHVRSPHRSVGYRLPALVQTQGEGSGVRVFVRPAPPVVSDEAVAYPREFRARY